MADIPFFGEDDAERVAANTRWGEEAKNHAVSFSESEFQEQRAPIYARLMAKDPIAGYWSAVEVVWKKDEWDFAKPDRFFDGDKNDYVRHKDFEDLQAGMIVMLKILVDTETGREDFIIVRDVTNPEAFVLYGPEGQNAGSSAKDWHMLRGGSVLSNVGELTLPATTLAVGQYLGIEVIFVETSEFSGSLGQGTASTMKSFQMVSAQYTNAKTPYWIAASDYSTVTVNHPIAILEEKAAGFARLTQHHAGDVHLEIFGSGESTEITIKCIKWIGCSKTGNEYTIKHKGPFASCPHSYEGHMGFDPNEFSCDELSGGTSLPDVIEWINANLIRIAQNLKWDEKGHIYGKDTCDGSTIYEDDDDDDDDDEEDYGDSQPFMTSNEFTAPPLLAVVPLVHVPASFLKPNIIAPLSGIDSKYWILNGDGTPQLKPIETAKLIQFTIVNSIGESMLAFRTGSVMKTFWQDPAFLVTVEKTAGYEFPAGNDQFYGFSTRFFRFNDTIEITGSIVAKGFPVTLEHNTLSVSDTVTLSQSVLRDLTDPQMEPFKYENSYDLDGMGFAYYNELAFMYQGNFRLKFSIDGGATFQSSISLDIDENGVVINPYEIVFDFIGQDVGEGDTIVLTSELLTLDTSAAFPNVDTGSVDGYDANVTSEHQLAYKEETDCATDGEENVSDDDDDCIEAGDIIPPSVCPPNFCGGEPSMAVSVVGVSGTINWVGETWNLPAESGVEKCVCPTTYIKGVDTGAFSVFDNYWSKLGAGAGEQLKLRRYQYIIDGPTFTSFNNSLVVHGDKDREQWTRIFASPPTADNVVSSDLNLILGEPMPTSGAYDFTPAFFGSHTISGITYTWAKGADWPV